MCDGLCPGVLKNKATPSVNQSLLRKKKVTQCFLCVYRMAFVIYFQKKYNVMKQRYIFIIHFFETMWSFEW